jgi:hypothetical protein
MNKEEILGFYLGLAAMELYREDQRWNGGLLLKASIAERVATVALPLP